MCVSRVLVFCRNPWFYFQILVIINQSLCTHIQVALFWFQSTLQDTYPWVPYHLSIAGCVKCCTRETRCAKLVRGVALNGWGCAGVRKKYFGNKFIAPSLNPNPTPSIAPGSIRDLWPELRGASRSATLQSQANDKNYCNNWIKKSLIHPNMLSTFRFLYWSYY